MKSIHLANHIDEILRPHDNLHIDVSACYGLLVQHAVGDNFITLIDVLLFLFDFSIQLNNLSFYGTDIRFIDFDFLIQLINNRLQLLHN